MLDKQEKVLYYIVNTTKKEIYMNDLFGFSSDSDTITVERNNEYYTKNSGGSDISRRPLSRMNDQARKIWLREHITKSECLADILDKFNDCKRNHLGRKIEFNSYDFSYNFEFDGGEFERDISELMRHSGELMREEKELIEDMRAALKERSERFNKWYHG